MKCGRCKQVGHSWKLCPQNPEATFRLDTPADVAEVVLARVRPLVRANAWAANFLDSLMLSCYLQGALDARTPELDAALRAAERAS